MDQVKSVVDLSIRSRAVSHALREAAEGVKGLGAGGRVPDPGNPPAPTPPTNRGVEITEGKEGGLEFSVDFLSLSIHASADLVLPWLLRLLPGVSRGDEVWEVFTESGQTGFYRRRLRGPFGLVVLAEPSAPGAPDHCHVDLSGSTCQAFGLAWVAEFLRWCKLECPWRVKVTRIDLAWDGSEVSPTRCWRALKRGDVRTRAKLENRGADEGRRPKCPVRRWEDLWKNQTVYVGGGSAQSLLRVYNYRGVNRVELQKRGDAADLVSCLLADKSVEKWSGSAVRSLDNYCAFVSRNSDSNASRRSPLVWWAGFLSLAGSCDVSFKRVADRIVKGAGLLVRQQRVLVERALRTIAATPAALVGDLVAAVDRARVSLPDRFALRLREVELALESIASGGGTQCKLFIESP